MDLLKRLLAAAILLAASLGLMADEAPVLERRVKAAYLSKFPAYIEWPAVSFPSPDSPIVIGVAGAEGLAQELESAVAGKRAADRPLAVRRLTGGESSLDCCHILFIGKGVSRARSHELLQLAHGRPILTVTEADMNAPAGSIINFLTAEDRIRFDISRDAATRSGLRLGSQLLAVARQVKPSP